MLPEALLYRERLTPKTQLLNNETRYRYLYAGLIHYKANY